MVSLVFLNFGLTIMTVSPAGLWSVYPKKKNTCALKCNFFLPFVYVCMLEQYTRLQVSVCVSVHAHVHMYACVYIYIYTKVWISLCFNVCVSGLCSYYMTWLQRRLFCAPILGHHPYTMNVDIVWSHFSSKVLYWFISVFFFLSAFFVVS